MSKVHVLFSASSSVLLAESTEMETLIFQQGGAKQIRIGTMNVESTCGGSRLRTGIPAKGGLEWHQAKRLSLLIEESGAEILCLQNINLYSTDISLLSRMLGSCWFICAAHQTTAVADDSRTLSDNDGYIVSTAGAQCGLVTFSKFQITEHRTLDLDELTKSTEPQRAAALFCRVKLPETGDLNVINVYLNNRHEDVRKEQLNILLNEHKTVGGHIICGGLNGLTREDYSDGAWEMLNLERREYCRAGYVESGQEVSCEMMKYINLNRSYRDCRREAGFPKVFAHGSKVEPTCRRDVRLDYVLLSKELPWAAKAHCYELLIPPQSIAEAHSMVLVELRLKSINSPSTDLHPTRSAGYMALDSARTISPRFSDLISERLTSKIPKPLTRRGPRIWRHSD